MKTLILILATTLALAGCGSSYDKYVETQRELITEALEHQKPLVKITAQEGQTITGLASVEVFAPQALPRIEQERPSQLIGAVERVAMGALGVAGTKVIADTALGVAQEIRGAGTHGYDYVNPTPVIAPDPLVVEQPPVQVVYPPPAQVVDPIIVPTPLAPAE